MSTNPVFLSLLAGAGSTEKAIDVLDGHVRQVKDLLAKLNMALMVEKLREKYPKAVSFRLVEVHGRMQAVAWDDGEDIHEIDDNDMDGRYRQAAVHARDPLLQHDRDTPLRIESTWVSADYTVMV